MSINERIEKESFKITEDCGSHDEVFRDGADFTLKAVIEMLEDRRDSKDISWSPIAELNEIINLLKSEA